MKRITWLKVVAVTATACLSFAQEPDNTAKNKRDQGSATETPDKQGNSKSDRKLLQAIRKSVVADKNLSTYAHNVKIVVNNGQATLRGPVKNSAEKEKVAELAKAAGATQIDNQIEIAPDK